MSRARTASSASSSGGHESQYIGSILAEAEDEGERQEPRGPIPSTATEVKDPIGFRSTSAPPQLAFLESNQPSTGETLQPDDLRLTPEYYTYYYSQRPLDPRLPPPVFNWSTWHYANRAKLGAFTEKDFLFRAGLKVGDLASLSKPSEKQETQPSPPSTSHYLDPALAPSTASSSTPSMSPILSGAPTGTEMDLMAKKAQIYSASSSTSSSPRLFSQAEFEDGLASLAHRFGAMGVGSGPRPRTDSDRDRETFGTPSSSPPASSLAQISSQSTAMPRFELGPASSTGPAGPSMTSGSTTSSSTGPVGTGFPMSQQYPTAMTKMPFPTITGTDPQAPSGPPVYPPFRGMGPNPSPMMAVMGYGHLGGPSRMALGALEPTPISPSLSASLPDRRGLPQESPPMVPLAGPGIDGLPGKEGAYEMKAYEEYRGPPPFGVDGGYGRGRPPMWSGEQPPPMRGRGGRGRGRGRGGVPFERKEGSSRSRPPPYGMGFPASMPSPTSGGGSTPPQTFKRGPAPSTPSMSLDPSQSAWLDDFRLNKTNSTLTLKDVVSRGLMLELATDQYGSRFIQQKLETASPEEKQAAFQQLLPETLRLCTDVFGNYVIQKFFEHGTFEHKKILASKLIGNVLMLSLQMYGCRVVQKALDVSDAETQALLVRELNGHVMECVKDQNGNHVIQKCIEKVPPYLIGFIVEAFSHQIVNLSTHPYGCRVIQRLLENCSETQRNAILTEILENVEDLCKNQYGNYVIQHVLIHGTPWHRGAIIRAVRGKILPLSKHKFASNVIEKCFAHASRQHRALLVEEVLGKEDRDPSKSPLISMVKDQYANYVIQKMVDVVDEDQRAMILHRIKRHVPNLRKIPYGKHIIARIEKLTGKPILP